MRYEFTEKWLLHDISFHKYMIKIKKNEKTQKIVQVPGN